MLQIVIQILANFLQHDATVRAEKASGRILVEVADVKMKETGEAYLIVPSLHLPDIDSAKEPVLMQYHRSVWAVLFMTGTMIRVGWKLEATHSADLTSF